jgi:hypothetical protein
MAVCFDGVPGKAFFNDQVMKKLIQQLFHLSFLNPPSLRRRQSGHDGVGDLPLSPAFHRQALGRMRG